MTAASLLIEPFADYAFMRRALVACIILSISGAPLGVFMNLRRMTLVGDAMSHAILPGVAVAFILFGASVWPMTLGGMATGIVIAIIATLLTRYAQLKEDASFAMVFLLSLAGGAVIVSANGNNVDLLHLLFGNILGIDRNMLLLGAGVSCASVLTLGLIYRGLVIECFDPDFMRASRKGAGGTSLVFFILLIANLVAAFQALGTLMALGLMILPAVAARFWTRNIDSAVPLSIVIGIAASVAGLVISFHVHVPAGPAIVLTTGAIALFSVLAGRYGSVRCYIFD
ncbi:MAG: metal ABC transporter permease [Alphaproteobacteria bacterium]|nr:metal ABC transporter permease [Alphaproteobacteria bacterium]